MSALRRHPAFLGNQDAARTNRTQVRESLAPRVQTKLTVGPPDDAYEREADSVANAVMRMPDEAVREGQVQRMCAECEEEQLQRKSVAADTLEIDPDLEVGLRSQQSGGQPLPDSTRAFFEPRLGADLSAVRVHSDATAARAASAVSARAFTLGPDIVFAKGAYAPNTSAGRELLAHELTHVVQQGAANAPAERLARAPADAAPAPAPAPAPARALVPLTFNVASTDLTPKSWGDRDDVTSGGADTRTNIEIGGPANATIDITHVRDDAQT